MIIWRAILPKARTAEPRAPLYLGRDGIPIRRRVAPLVRRLQQICAAMVTAVVADADLVQLEFAVLVFIDDMPGIDQRTLAAAMGIDRNNVGVILERLEARGLIERPINGTDRRARSLRVTAKGSKLWRSLGPGIIEADARILAPLTGAERESFLDMLVRLVETHRVHAVPGGGRRRRSPKSFKGKISKGKSSTGQSSTGK